MLTVGSLFSGIGGLDRGLELAGMRILWQVEKSSYCRKILAREWPHAKQLVDVRHAGAHNLEVVDLICGGFPCQDISNVGRRAGIIAGVDSGLWREYFRIVSELRPRFVLVENVSALLVRGLDVVLGNLAEIGYDAEWETLSAAAVGAPHARERCFVVAYSERARLEGYAGNGIRAGRWALASRSVGASGLLPGANPGGRWNADPGIRRVAHGIPDRVERIEALGNAVVPELAEWVGRQLLATIADATG